MKFLASLFIGSALLATHANTTLVGVLPQLRSSAHGPGDGCQQQSSHGTRYAVGVGVGIAGGVRKEPRSRPAGDRSVGKVRKEPRSRPAGQGEYGSEVQVQRERSVGRGPKAQGRGYSPSQGQGQASWQGRPGSADKSQGRGNSPSRGNGVVGVGLGLGLGVGSGVQVQQPSYQAYGQSTGGHGLGLGLGVGGFVGNGYSYGEKTSSSPDNYGRKVGQEWGQNIIVQGGVSGFNNGQQGPNPKPFYPAVQDYTKPVVPRPQQGYIGGQQALIVGGAGQINHGVQVSQGQAWNTPQIRQGQQRVVVTQGHRFDANGKDIDC